MINKQKIQWGILGCGRIAHEFAQGLRNIPDAGLQACAAREGQRAASFAREYGFARSYGSYQELAGDPDVDIVYVATTHNFHKEHTMLLMNAGKSVLCEKAFALNARQAEEMAACARENGVFLMEAMWTRFLPAIVQVKRWLDSGAIGQVRLIKAELCFRLTDDPLDRVNNIDLAGGALLDVGVYPISFAQFVYGQLPIHVSGFSKLGPTGVDQLSAYLLGYPGGQTAVLSSSVHTQAQNDAIIVGAKGSIRIPEFWHAQSADLRLHGQKPEHFDGSFTSTGYDYEARHAQECLRKGLRESPVIPLSESRDIMGILDNIRRQIELVYPGEA
jgi:predicted dehydrogenase